METIVHWLETHQLPCFFFGTFGVECPGCGIQRAFVLLLKGEILRSFVFYPPLIPILFLFIFLTFHLVLHFRNGAVYLKYVFICTAFAVLINFICRLINHA